MSKSIIVSFIGPFGNVLLEMQQSELDPLPYVRTYKSIDEAIGRFEALYEQFHGEQSSSRMGEDFEIDPRIHEVEGSNVQVLVDAGVVEIDDFYVVPTRTSYGILSGGLATGQFAHDWHVKGLVPGHVKI